MGPGDVTVEWEVFADETLSRRLRRGRTRPGPRTATPSMSRSRDSAPDRWYWYRFRAAGETSRVGRTRTMPARGPRPDAPALRAGLVPGLPERLLRRVPRPGRAGPRPRRARRRLHLRVRRRSRGGAPAHRRRDRDAGRLPQPATRSIASTRMLQDAHARFPFVVTWDDHEVENNYAGDRARRTRREPRSSSCARRAAGLPGLLRAHAVARGRRVPGARHDPLPALDFGRLASFFVLDTRQFRTPINRAAHGSIAPRVSGGPSIRRPRSSAPRRSAGSSAASAGRARPGTSSRSR